MGGAVFLFSVKCSVSVTRVHSSNSQISVNGTRLTGVSQFSFSKEQDATDLRGLGSFYVDDRITQSNSKIETTIEWALGKNISDPFFDIQQSGLLSIENFLIEAKDTVGTNTFSGAYLTSYGINASVGDIIKGTVKYDVDSQNWSPNALSITDQTNDSCLPFVPSRITIHSTAEGGVSSSGMSIQSFNFSLPINRKPVKRAGSKNVSFRYPELPIIGDISFSILKNTLTGMKEITVLEKGTIEINLEDCLTSGERNFLFQNCNLISINESLSLDGNASIDFGYKFSYVDVYDTQNYLLDSNNLIMKSSEGYILLPTLVFAP